MTTQSKDTFEHNIKGFVYSYSGADNLEPFKSSEPDLAIRSPVSNGTIVEVDEHGNHIKVLASIQPDGSFSINETRDEWGIRARVIAKGCSCEDLNLRGGSSNSYEIKVEQIYAALYNAHQPDVSFIHWKMPNPPQNAPFVMSEFIFRDDGFLAIKRSNDKWTSITRYKTVYSQNSRGYKLKTASMAFNSDWIVTLNHPTFIVNPAKQLNIWYNNTQRNNPIQFQYL